MSEKTEIPDDKHCEILFPGQKKKRVCRYKAQTASHCNKYDVDLGIEQILFDHIHELVLVKCDECIANG